MAESHGRGRDRTDEEQRSDGPDDSAADEASEESTSSETLDDEDGASSTETAAGAADNEPEDAQERGGFDWRHFREVPPAVVVLLFMIYFYVTLDQRISGRRGQTFIDPDFWPSALLGFGILLGLLYLAQAVRQGLRAQRGAAAKRKVVTTALGDADEPGAGKEAGAPAGDSHAATRRIGALVVAAILLGGYIFVMRTVGFIPSTLVFAVLFLLLVGERRWWVVAGLPPLVAAAVVAIFTRVLVVPLPRGSGFFLELSTWFY